jgi:hypothetical protein
MSESDFGKKTAAAETGRHHDKQHRTSFGETTSRRSSNQRTRAAHHSKNQHQKGTTFMKRKATAIALVLFTVTLLFVTTTTLKAATFGTGNTAGGNVTFSNTASGVGNRDWETRFTSTAVTLGGSTFATTACGQTARAVGWKTTTPITQRWLRTNRSRTGTMNTSTSTTGGITGRFTISQGTGSNFNFTDTGESFDGPDPNFNQFF